MEYGTLSRYGGLCAVGIRASHWWFIQHKHDTPNAFFFVVVYFFSMSLLLVVIKPRLNSEWQCQIRNLLFQSNLLDVYSYQLDLLFNRSHRFAIFVLFVPLYSLYPLRLFCFVFFFCVFIHSTSLQLFIPYTDSLTMYPSRCCCCCIST